MQHTNRKFRPEQEAERDPISPLPPVQSGFSSSVTLLERTALCVCNTATAEPRGALVVMVSGSLLVYFGRLLVLEMFFFFSFSLKFCQSERNVILSISEDEDRSEDISFHFLVNLNNSSSNFGAKHSV